MSSGLEPPDRDVSLMGLTELVAGFTGHIEDMDDDQRVWALGMFAGAVSRLQLRVIQLWLENGQPGGYLEALPVLHQVMLALGASEDWHAGLERT